METKFRGLRKDGKGWVYGCPAYGFTQKIEYIMPQMYFATRDFGEIDEKGNPIIEDEIAIGGYIPIKPDTVGQFIGLKDKNGKEIYTKDRVKYFKFERYVQQSHADINPEIDEPIIIEKIGTVEFIDSAFVFKEDHDDCFVSPISNYGLHDLEELQKQFEYEEGVYSDVNGTEINESILGLEVIGNVFENSELIK